MNKIKPKYSLAFTAGALLHNEYRLFFEYYSIQNNEIVFDYNVLQTNAESSRKRKGFELIKRAQSVSPEILKIWFTLTEKDQLAMLYYMAMKTYPVIRDFVLDKVVPSWRRLNIKLENQDFTNFIYEKSNQDQYLGNVNENTLYKSGQIVLKMLKEVGMLSNGNLQKVLIGQALANAVHTQGDEWFFDALLMSSNDKLELK